jgi:tRNA/rRNA methyltransferase
MVSIILMEPEHPGNIGAVARVMANFDLFDLYLINPKVDHLSSESIARSKHAKHLLESAKIIKYDEIKNYFDIVIATTAKLGSDYNLPRSPLISFEVAEFINKMDNTNIGILFGREGNGLSNEEIMNCDFIMNIPSSETYSTLNLSHSICIVCYELFKSRGIEDIKRKFKPISEIDKRVILEKMDKIFDKLSFSSEEKKNTQKRFWKKLLGKSFMTKREAYILMGFIKKINEKLD